MKLKYLNVWFIECENRLKSLNPTKNNQWLLNNNEK